MIALGHAVIRAVRACRVAEGYDPGDTMVCAVDTLGIVTGVAKELLGEVAATPQGEATPK